MPVFLITDAFIFVLLALSVLYGFKVARLPHWRANWVLIFQRPAAMVSALILGIFILLAVLDSIHYRPALQADVGQVTRYASDPVSVLDLLLKPLGNARERSYSEPLSAQGFRKESTEREGQTFREYPRLKFGGAHLSDPASQRLNDIKQRSCTALWQSLLCLLLALSMGIAVASRRQAQTWYETARRFWRGDTQWPWRSMCLTVSLMTILIFWLVQLSEVYHVLGTDRTGNSVLVFALKSVRTALVIGSLTTLVVLPLALALGITAGYLRGWVDEVIQYIYTLLASIPDVLLIAASVLLLQVFIDKNQGFFDTALERADARLFFLCLILGITSFTGLCRLVRGETLKLRELEYIQSAKAFGVSTPRILRQHIMPNLMHLVLINTVMQFSGFVLAEAVLSYVGVGVDPKTASFGVMINTARMELAATPVVWWTLATAFVFMLLIVLSANLLSDAVRDAFDPRMRLRASRKAPPASMSNDSKVAA
jgi:peptide/nickel transport system permease protein